MQVIIVNTSVNIRLFPPMLMMVFAIFRAKPVIEQEPTMIPTQAPGDRYGYGRLRARYHRIKNILEGHSRILSALRHDDREYDRIERSHDNRLSGEEQHVNEEDDRECQMTVLLHDLGHLRKLILRGSLHSHLLSPHLDLEQDAHVVDDCRDDRG